MSEEKIFNDLKNLLIENLDVESENITMESSLIDDLSADSLDLVEIVMGMEDLYGITIPEDSAEKFKAVKDVVEYIKENT